LRCIIAGNDQTDFGRTAQSDRDLRGLDWRGPVELMLVDAPDDPTSSSQAAVALVSRGEADALMKGSQHTDELLSAVISREADLCTSRRMSHCFWFDLPAYHKPLMVTDGVVNIAPGLTEKIDILANHRSRALPRCRTPQNCAIGRRRKPSI
jgi:hypothetical protein